MNNPRACFHQESLAIYEALGDKRSRAIALGDIARLLAAKGEVENEHDCVDRHEAQIPGESIGTVVSTHDTIRAAFKANEAFQKRMRGQRREGSRPHKNRHAESTTLAAVSMSNSGMHLFEEGKSEGRVKRRSTTLVPVL